MLPRSEPRAVAQGVDVMAERRRQNRLKYCFFSLVFCEIDFKFFIFFVYFVWIYRDLFTSSAPIPFAPMNNNKGRNRTSSVVEE